MKLLFVVLNSPDQLEEVLEGLIEVGVTGATVVDSVGMGHIIEYVPLFAGMKDTFRSSQPHNKMIFSVISDNQAPETLVMLETILACSQQKHKGIAFTMPIDAAIGVHKEA
jgi:nitrogen regulatory protein P-II 1